MPPQNCDLTITSYNIQLFVSLIMAFAIIADRLMYHLEGC